MTRTSFTPSLILAITSVTAALAEPPNWPQWRGPTLNGVAEGSPPIHWSEKENVIWRADLPAWAAATPIVWGERVFVVTPSKLTGPDDFEMARSLRMRSVDNPGGRDVLLQCRSMKDGALIWERKLSPGNALWGKHNMASCSPVTNGKQIIALAGTGQLVAYDMDGAELWRHDLQDMYGPIAPGWGYASSPLLFEDKVVVAVMQGDGPSYVAAFKAVTGDLAWKVERVTDAKRECPDAYTTPTISRVGDRTDLVISGADWVTGHDPASGAERWRAGGLNPEGRGNYRICGSPTVVGEVIYCTSRVSPILAIRGGGTGDVTESGRLWRYDGKGGPDVPTPVCDGKRYYIVDDRGRATCLNARDGEVIWGPERTAEGTVSASPILAGDRVYVVNERGVTTVFKAADKFEIIATNELDDDFTMASPVVVGETILIRTSKALYRISERRE
ncbi:MAG: PQQ-binding-like beta-propeller repeat protein [Phycisphaerales bacterium]|nr:PQQ-binding-like beta-propeller repeat protein [Phycisphaerales bacterium]